MDQAKIFPLETARLIDETQVGLKAASLFRLSRAGLAVPPGFCVTAAVFREHIERNNLTDRIKSAANELVKTNPEAKAAVLSYQPSLRSEQGHLPRIRGLEMGRTERHDTVQRIY